MAKRPGGGEWGYPVPLLSDPPPYVREVFAMVKDAMANNAENAQRVAAYRKQLADDLGTLEVRIMTALHYFGMAGVPESEKSQACRRDDPEKWWKYVDQFVALCESWNAKMVESFDLRLGHKPDPPDLLLLILPYLDDPDEGDLY